MAINGPSSNFVSIVHWAGPLYHTSFYISLSFNIALMHSCMHCQKLFLVSLPPFAKILFLAQEPVSYRVWHSCMVL